MPKVQAIVNVPFGNGVQPKGAVFDATQQEANLLVALKRVVLVKETVAPKNPDSTVESETPAPTKTEAPKRSPTKQTYRTRDLKSQD